MESCPFFNSLRGNPSLGSAKVSKRIVLANDTLHATEEMADLFYKPGSP